MIVIAMGVIFGLEDSKMYFSFIHENWNISYQIHNINSNNHNNNEGLGSYLWELKQTIVKEKND